MTVDPKSGGLFVGFSSGVTRDWQNSFPKLVADPTRQQLLTQILGNLGSTHPILQAGDSTRFRLSRLDEILGEQTGHFTETLGKLAGRHRNAEPTGARIDEGRPIGRGCFQRNSRTEQLESQLGVDPSGLGIDPDRGENFVWLDVTGQFVRMNLIRASNKCSAGQFGERRLFWRIHCTFPRGS